ncbi:MAG: hypothetical protein EOO45_05665 [Flavobacterium sp.]|nr:MAG: hypothetical protein EOO45_05665 [Flavobacterium sp.]
MTNKKWKALAYNFLCFAVLYTAAYFLIVKFTNLEGFWIPITAAVVSSILAPKFQVINYQGEDKIFMKWMFTKGVREIK